MRIKDERRGGDFLARRGGILVAALWWGPQRCPQWRISSNWKIAVGEGRWSEHYWSWGGLRPVALAGTSVGRRDRLCAPARQTSRCLWCI